jgi:hypothetical protein
MQERLAYGQRFGLLVKGRLQYAEIPGRARNCRFGDDAYVRLFDGPGANAGGAAV